MTHLFNLRFSKIGKLFAVPPTPESLRAFDENGDMHIRHEVRKHSGITIGIQRGRRTFHHRRTRERDKSVPKSSPIPQCTTMFAKPQQTEFDHCVSLQDNFFGNSRRKTKYIDSKPSKPEMNKSLHRCGIELGHKTVTMTLGNFMSREDTMDARLLKTIRQIPRVTRKVAIKGKMNSAFVPERKGMMLQRSDREAQNKSESDSTQTIIGADVYDAAVERKSPNDLLNAQLKKVLLTLHRNSTFGIGLGSPISSNENRAKFNNSQSPITTAGEQKANAVEKKGTKKVRDRSKSCCWLFRALDMREVWRQKHRKLKHGMYINRAVESSITTWIKTHEQNFVFSWESQVVNAPLQSNLSARIDLTLRQLNKYCYLRDLHTEKIFKGLITTRSKQKELSAFSNLTQWITKKLRASPLTPGKTCMIKSSRHTHSLLRKLEQMPLDYTSKVDFMLVRAKRLMRFSLIVLPRSQLLKFPSVNNCPSPTSNNLEIASRDVTFNTKDFVSAKSIKTSPRSTCKDVSTNPILKTSKSPIPDFELHYKRFELKWTNVISIDDFNRQEAFYCFVIGFNASMKHHKQATVAFVISHFKRELDHLMSSIVCKTIDYINSYLTWVLEMQSLLASGIALAAGHTILCDDIFGQSTCFVDKISLNASHKLIEAQESNTRMVKFSNALAHYMQHHLRFRHEHLHLMKTLKTYCLKRLRAYCAVLEKYMAHKVHGDLKCNAMREDAGINKLREKMEILEKFDGMKIDTLLEVVLHISKVAHGAIAFAAQECQMKLVKATMI